MSEIAANMVPNDDQDDEIVLPIETVGATVDPPSTATPNIPWVPATPEEMERIGHTNPAAITKFFAETTGISFTSVSGSTFTCAIVRMRSGNIIIGESMLPDTPEATASVRQTAAVDSALARFAVLEAYREFEERNRPKDV